jgi:predicted Fe-Mo cluster-binding NifX family protein
MRKKRVFIPLYKDEVAPRFDLAAEVLIADVSFEEGGVVSENILLSQPSVNNLCDLALQKEVDVVICGGIEEQYYHFLRWKRMEVLDNVAGRALSVLDRFSQGTLKAGDILFSTEAVHAR